MYIFHIETEFQKSLCVSSSSYGLLKETFSTPKIMKTFTYDFIFYNQNISHVKICIIQWLSKNGRVSGSLAKPG